MATTLLDTPVSTKGSATSLLQSGAELFSMLGMGTDKAISTTGHEVGVPSDENYVICAILDDAAETRVRIGSARFHTPSRAYHMLDGSLQISESCRSHDGLYRNSSGTYALLTSKEFATQSSKPPAPAFTSKPVSVVPDAPPGPIPMRTPSLSSLLPLTSLPPVAIAQKPPCTVAKSMIVPIRVPRTVSPSSLKLSGLGVKDVGCGLGSDTKTLFVSGNFEGDTTRLSVVMEQSRPLALKAAARGNKIMYAFMGNCVPDVHRADQDDGVVDSFTRIVEMSENGIELSETQRVAADSVILLSGSRELAWLRLANPNPLSREITVFDDKNVLLVLTRGSVVADMNRYNRKAPMKLHNDSLAHFSGVKEPSVVSVAMLLKLISISQITMQAPGLVSAFVKKLRSDGHTDDASLASLVQFLSNCKGTIKEGMSKLIDSNNQLTPEGLGIMPAAKAVVGAVIKFAQSAATRYMRKSKLVHYVSNTDMDSGSGLWLTPRGTDYGSMVGRMPIGIESSSMRVKWKEGPPDRVEWSKALNNEFGQFVDAFMKGTNEYSNELYQAFVAMSLASHSDLLPLKDLSTSPSTTCSGVTANASTPFGTLQRRILVRQIGTRKQHQSDLLCILDQWTNINTDAYTPSTYWGIATWCGGTKLDIGHPTLTVNNSDSLKKMLRDVSVTLASLLTVRVKDKIVKDYGVEGLDGLLGPVLLASSTAQKQSMRLVSFTHEHMDTAFVVMLPEAFVQWSLDYYNYDIKDATVPTAPMLATEGFLALPDEASVPLGFPGVSEAEIETIRSDLGPRAWALPKKRSSKLISSFTTIDYSAIKAMLKSDGPSRALPIPGYSIYHTLQNNADPFSGLRVGLTKVPGETMEARMTIVADSSVLHDVFRVVARE